MRVPASLLLTGQVLFMLKAHGGSCNSYLTVSSQFLKYVYVCLSVVGVCGCVLLDSPTVTGRDLEGLTTWVSVCALLLGRGEGGKAGRLLAFLSLWNCISRVNLFIPTVWGPPGASQRQEEKQRGLEGP